MTIHEALAAWDARFGLGLRRGDCNEVTQFVAVTKERYLTLWLQKDTYVLAIDSEGGGLWEQAGDFVDPPELLDILSEALEEYE